jgi:hypothetical protein
MGCGIRRSYPVPRISTPENAFPRTRVNKGKKAQTGHGRMLMKALKEVPSIEPAGAGKTALVRRGRITIACTGNESPVGGRASLVDVGCETQEPTHRETHRASGTYFS